MTCLFADSFFIPLAMLWFFTMLGAVIGYWIKPNIFTVFVGSFVFGLMIFIFFPGLTSALDACSCKLVV